MKTVTLKIKDIAILNKIKQKLDQRESLTSSQKDALYAFLAHLPPTEQLLSERASFDKTLKIKVFDINEMWLVLKKWIDLFNGLPKNGHSHYPYACWVNADESPNLCRDNIVIHVVFVPSLAYSKRSEKENKIIGLNLKTDGTAAFEFWMVEDAENFPTLYKFKGSWKDAYLLTVKTLQQGWPQTDFPLEFEQLL